MCKHYDAFQSVNYVGKPKGFAVIAETAVITTFETKLVNTKNLKSLEVRHVFSILVPVNELIPYLIPPSRSARSEIQISSLS